jgi:hypothetical protein
MKTYLLLLAAVACAAGCTTTYSQLDGRRYHRVPIDTYAVAISRVDGESYLRNPVQVEAGPRKIVVQGPPTRTGGYGELREFDLDVKPCTRYYLVAVKRGPLLSDFTVKVDHEEPLAGCRVAATAAAQPSAPPEAAAAASAP